MNSLDYSHDTIIGSPGGKISLIFKIRLILRNGTGPSGCLHPGRRRTVVEDPIKENE